MLMITGCEKPTPPVKIAINPWPGYEFLYLAEQKGFYKKFNLNVKLVQLSSLSDVERVYLQGRVDGIASTLIEAVQIGIKTNEPISVVLIPDYSNGGDVIMAKPPLTSLSELKGKRVGAEITSLGIFFLQRALMTEGLSLNDLNVLHVEQLEAASFIKNDKLDAVVTYPPFSIEINELGFKTVFDSGNIPGDIIDVVTVKESIIQADPTWVSRFHKLWQYTLDYAENNQEEAYRIMATRENLTVTEFKDALTGLEIIPSSKQNEYLSSPSLKENIVLVCETMTRAGDINYDCSHIKNIIKPVSG